MAFAKSGIVYEERLAREKCATLLRLRWTADATTFLAVAPIQLAPLDYILERVVVTDYGGTGTFDLYLYDELDVDALGGDGVGLTAAATTEVLPGLTLAAGTQRRSRLQLMGQYWLYVSHASAAVTGVADLYLLHPKHTM